MIEPFSNNQRASSSLRSHAFAETTQELRLALNGRFGTSMRDKVADSENMPVICPTSQNVFEAKASMPRSLATLHGVVFDILVGSQAGEWSSLA